MNNLSVVLVLGLPIQELWGAALGSRLLNQNSLSHNWYLMKFDFCYYGHCCKILSLYGFINTVFGCPGIRLAVWKIALPYDSCVFLSSYGILMEFPSSWVFSEVCFWMKKCESFFPLFSSFFPFLFFFFDPLFNLDVCILITYGNQSSSVLFSCYVKPAS